MSMKDSVRGAVSWARMRAWLGLALLTVAAAAAAGFMIGHSVGRSESTPAGVDVSSLPEYVDRGAAAQAAADGEPFVYRDPDASCWVYLRLPDGQTFVMDDATSGVPPRGADRQRERIGCSPLAAAVPAGADASGMPPYIDREMAADAARDGRPFLYQLRDGPVPCWPRLRMPDGRTYGMEQARDADTGVTPRAGYILQYGCELPEVAAQLPPR